MILFCWLLAAQHSLVLYSLVWSREKETKASNLTRPMLLLETRSPLSPKRKQEKKEKK
jgi:hypothetical protein